MYPSKAMMITVHSQRPKLTSAFGKSSDLWEQQNNLECAHSNGSVTTNNEFPFHNSTLARYKCSLLYALPSITVTGQKAAVLIKIWTLGTLDLLHIFMVQLAIMSYLDPQNQYKLRLDPSSISSGCCRCPNTTFREATYKLRDQFTFSEIGPVQFLPSTNTDTGEQGLPGLQCATVML